MNSKPLTKLATWVTAGLLVAASMAACGETADCKTLRDQTYANKRVWDACDPKDPFSCVLEPGNPKDCTGVLSCNFAVNPIYRSEAELASYRIGEQSQGCFLCAIPNCLAGEIALCEPISQRCIVVTAVEDAGAPVSLDDAGAPTGVDSSPPTDANTSEPDSSTTIPDAPPG